MTVTLVAATGDVDRVEIRLGFIFGTGVPTNVIGAVDVAV